MAENPFLQALQDPLYTSGETYSGIGAGAVAGALPALVDPYASTGSNALNVMGGSILAALLGRMAKNDAAEENKVIATQQAQFLNSDPNAQLAMVQENPRVFSKLQAALNTESMAQQMKDKSMQRELELKEPYLIKQENRAIENEVRLKTDPRLTGLDNLENRQKLFDTERALTNDFTKHPVITDFKYKEQGLKALTEAYQDKAGTSDFEILRRTAQMVEPGLAVRQDDQDSLIGAASALGMSLQTVKNIVSGESKLDPNVRAGMLRIAQRAYDTSLQDYNTLRLNFVDRSRGGGLNPDAVVPYGAGVPFKELYPDLNIADGQPLNPVKLTAKDFAERAKADGVPMSEALAAWEQYKRENF